MKESVGGYLLQRLFAEWAAEVVVQTPLYAVFTEGMTTWSGDWLKKQSSDGRERHTISVKRTG